MKKFKFRLERVLQYRELVKDEKKRELILRNNQLYEDNQRLEELRAAALMNEVENQLALTAEKVYLIGMYGKRLKAEIEDQTEVVKQSEEDAAEAHVNYVKAATEAESLVILRKRKLEEYKEYVEQEEGKFLDELTTQRAKRNSRRN